MKCPDVPLPERLRNLDRDPRGYPIFWAATNPDVPGEYSFRGIYATRALESVSRKLCQLCGGDLAYWICFAGGPKSVENRTFSEPPMHRDCLEYAFRVCPFLLRSGWDRSRQQAAQDYQANAPGAVLTKPEKMGIYITRDYTWVYERGRLLIFPAPAKGIIWMTEDTV